MVRSPYPLAACLAGVLLAFAVFPAGLLLGLPEYWAHLAGDNAGSWIGYEAFARDAWRWPVFTTQLLSPPVGVNVLFTDPIPLLALPAKAVFKSTGWLPVYFGPWLLLAYALQPLTGYGLLRSLRLPRPHALMGGLLFLLTPAFLYRYGHFTLLAHWTILAALLLHVLIVRDGRTGIVAAGGLFTLAFVLVHPYLLVMVLAIYLAALADAALRRRIRSALAAAAALACLAAIPALALLAGFIEPGKTLVAAGGFGKYSMNLLSPVVPQLSLWPGAHDFMLDPIGGQYEGYNWLGLGIIGLLAAALLLAPGRIARLLRAAPVLVLACLGMAVYALSSQVYAGTHLLLSIAPEKLGPLTAVTTLFRASGRFFWPLGYLMLLVGLVALSRRLPRRFLVVAAPLLALQLADVVPLLQSVAARAAPEAPPVPTTTWAAALARRDALVLLPQYSCAELDDQHTQLTLQLLAAHQGKPTNSVYVNRGTPPCEAERLATAASLRALATTPDPLVVAFTTGLAPGALRASADRAGLVCRVAGALTACAAQDDRTLAALGEPLGAGDKVTPGQRLSTAEKGPGLDFLVAGWTPPAPWGSWGAGPDSVLTLPFSRPLCGPLALTLTVLPFEFGAHLVDHADILLNGAPAGRIALPRAGVQTVAHTLPNAGCIPTATIALRFENLRSPRSLGMNDDPRLINWGLQAFSIVEAR